MERHRRSDREERDDLSVKGVPRAIHSVIRRGVARLGVREPAATPVASTLLREWKVLLASVLLAILLPLFELGIVNSLFAILSPEDRGLRLWTRQALEFIAVASHNRATTLTLFLVCVLTLSLYVATRFLQKRLSLDVNVRTYLLYGRALVSAYLSAPPRVNARLQRNEFAAALYEELWLVAGLAHHLVASASSLLSALILILGAFVVSAPISSGAVVVAAVVGLLFRRRYRLHRAIVEEKWRVQPALLGRVMDVLDGYRSIRLAGAERTFADRLTEAFKKNTGWRIGFVTNQTFLSTMSQALVYLLMIVVVGVATLVTADSGGTVLVILVLMQRILSSLNQLQQDWIKVHQASGASEKAFKLLEECRSPGLSAHHAADGFPNEPIESVVFEDVSFSYPPGPAIYGKLSLRLEAGDRVLVQGVSGTGKSTLGLLACGLLEPTAGRVCINDRPLDETVFRSVRSSICYISPDLHVFDMPLRDNILLADGGGRTIDGVLACARLVDVAGRLQDRPEASVGKNGCALSLGERQRLLLAQAFLKTPSLVVLDEATANLDIDLEDDLLADLMAALSTRGILLVIAHKRPRKVAFTREYVLREGRLYSAALSTAVEHNPAIR